MQNALFTIAIGSRALNLPGLSKKMQFQHVSMSGSHLHLHAGTVVAEGILSSKNHLFSEHFICVFDWQALLQHLQMLLHLMEMCFLHLMQGISPGQKWSARDMPGPPLACPVDMGKQTDQELAVQYSRLRSKKALFLW